MSWWCGLSQSPYRNRSTIPRPWTGIEEPKNIDVPMRDSTITAAELASIIRASEGQITFQISLRATFVILNVVKNLCLLFLLCGEGWRSQEVHLAGNRPKGNRRSFVAAFLRMTNRGECSENSKCDCPGAAPQPGWTETRIYWIGRSVQSDLSAMARMG
jgi:hypothetical protein